MIRKNGPFTTQIAIQIRDFDSRITVLKVISIRESQKILNRPVVWNPSPELRYFFRFATYHPALDWFFKGKFMHT